MSFKFNPFTENLDIVRSDAEISALVLPAGSDTQVQFNDGGVFGADSDFAYNKTTNTLSLGSSTTGGIMNIASTLGAELFAGFAAIDWTCTYGWSADGVQLVKVVHATTTGTATCTNASSIPVVGNSYKITVTCSAKSGNISLSYAGESQGFIAVGTNTYYVKAATVGNIIFSGTKATTCTITGITLQLLDTATGTLSVDAGVTHGNLQFKNRANTIRWGSYDMIRHDSLAIHLGYYAAVDSKGVEFSAGQSAARNMAQNAVTTSGACIAIGSGAGQECGKNATTCHSNFALGSGALTYVASAGAATTVAYLTAIGVNAAGFAGTNSTVEFSKGIFLGYCGNNFANNSATTTYIEAAGYYNVWQAFDVTTGNVRRILALGSYSHYYAGKGVTTGDFNDIVSLGFESMYQYSYKGEAFTNVIALGTYAGKNCAGSNKLYIGAVSGTHLLVGDFSTKWLQLNGGLGVGIGTTVGSEKLTNGTFTGSATGWTLASGWAYNSNNVTHSSNGTGTLTQAGASMVTPVVAGDVYKLTYTLSGWTTGIVTPSCGGITLPGHGSNGTFVEYFAAISTADLAFTPTNAARFLIDTISLVKVTDGNVALGGTLYADKITAPTNTLTFGTGTADTDLTFAFTGTSNSGQFKWMEDEDYFEFGDDILLPDNEAVKFGTGVDMSIYYDGSLANIKTDLVTPSDLNIDCGTSKTIVLEIPVYKDINIAGALLSKPASSYPGTDTFRTSAPADTGITTYAFAEDEKLHGGFELQHDYKEGTDIVFHVHFQIIDAPTGTDNVQWRLAYVVQRDGVTLTTVTTIDSPDTPVDTQYRTYRSDFGAITGSTFKIGDQFMFTLTRVSATGDAFAGDCLIETAGIHYQVDTLGSRSISAK